MLRRQKIRRRSGMTLIELLVVVFIVLLITAIAIPILTPSLEQRRGRETSRLLTSFIQGARTKAIQTGRPVGVAFGQAGGAVGTVNVLHYVEVPPPYAGDNVGSLLTVNAKAVATNLFTTVTASPLDSGWIGLLRPYDSVKFNYQGRTYRLGAVNPATDLDANGYFLSTVTTWTITAADGTGIVPPPGSYPFQIHRLPVFTAAAPLLLPSETIIDMAVSGYDAAGVFGVGEMAIILFSPNGSLVGIINSVGTPVSPTSPVHLMVGRVDQIPGAGTPLLNYQDLTNFWVSINPLTGLVSSTEVSGDQNNDGAISLPESRYFAQQAQSMGGR